MNFAQGTNLTFHAAGGYILAVKHVMVRLPVNSSHGQLVRYLYYRHEQ